MATIERGAQDPERERARRGHRPGFGGRRTALTLIATGTAGILVAAGVLAASADAGGRPATAPAAEVGVGLGTARSLPSGYYGVNYDFSLNAGGNEKTFADALATSTQALLLATAMPDTTQTDFWSSFGPENPYAYLADPSSPTEQTTATLTPDGQVMTWIDQAAQSATAITPITFSGGPMLSGTSDSALVGASFTKGTSATQILVNLSGQTQIVQVGTAVPDGQPYQQMSTADATVKIDSAADATQQDGTTSAAAGLSLAPYSVTIVA
ncbi:MAG TPA: hypothetical protein VGM10_22810 [Actinocrinis sp.]|jgi:hypothetical protein